MGRLDIASIDRAFVDAAMDSSRWNAAMEIVAVETGARGAALFSIRGRLPLMPHSESMAPGFETYVRDGWIHRDERFKAVPAVLRKNVATEFDFTTPDEISRNPYYQEFLAPLKFRWFAGVLVGADDNQWSLSLQRTISQGPFPREQLDVLAHLSRRLSSAAAVAKAFGFARTAGLLDAFELSDTAVVQLDKRGGVLGLNMAAERLIGRGISIVQRRLVADRREATEALERCLHTVIWSTDKVSLAAPVSLPRAGRRPLLAYTLGLTSVADNPFTDCRAIVVLIDPERRRMAPEQLLRTAFGLTGAEARLASRLATGAPIESISEDLGVTKETARNQLKAVFAKTGIHRQAELVALIGAILSQYIGL